MNVVAVLMPVSWADPATPTRTLTQIWLSLLRSVTPVERERAYNALLRSDKDNSVWFRSIYDASTSLDEFIPTPRRGGFRVTCTAPSDS